MKLLVRAQDPISEARSWIGGEPCAPPELAWPYCQSCEAPMQFLAQIDLRELAQSEGPGYDGWLLLFECQQNPGMCDNWDPDSGGNAARVAARAGAVAIHPPEPAPDPDENPLQPGFEALAVIGYSCGDRSEQEAYTAALRDQALEVRGKLGGQAQWIADDESPLCQCGQSMRFVVQLEEGRELSFGGGWGLAFICDSCKDQAKFLWQQ